LVVVNATIAVLGEGASESWWKIRRVSIYAGTDVERVRVGVG
jgi:hypothetical protein